MRTRGLLLLLALGLSGCDEVTPAGPDCPAALPGWLAPGAAPFHQGYRPRLWVGMAGDQPTWNGKPVDSAGLDKRLKLASDPDLSPRPFILFDPAGASDCDAAAQVRDEIDRQAACGKSGLCGQGDAAAFARAPNGATIP